MIVPGSASPLLASAGGYNLTKSLRFRSGASARLTRTPASASNRKTYTISAWVKLGSLDSSSIGTIFCAGDSSTSTSTHLYFYLDQIRFYWGGAGGPEWRTTQVFRDYSGWYHIVAAVDTNQSVLNDKLKLYINGVQVTSWVSQNSIGVIDTQINNTVAHALGSNAATAQYLFDGYMTEFNLIDGQQLTPNSFGTFNSLGVWQPIRYGGSYGTNGFYLPFTSGDSTFIGSYNGSSAFFNAANNAAFAFGTGSLTIEAWVYPTQNSYGAIFDTRSTGSGGPGVSIYANSGNGIILVNNTTYNPSTYLSLNQWSHIAAVRNGASSWTVYINGNSVLTFTDSSNLTDNGCFSGKNYAGTFFFGGAISNLRVVKGTAVYTSNFILPTSPLTNISGTSLLTLQNSTLIDNSTNAFSLTNTGPITLGTSYPFSAAKIFNDQGPAGNNWTPNNFSGASGSTLDYMTDVPTLTSATVANYCVINPIASAVADTYSQANLRWTKVVNTTNTTAVGSIAISSGKWYWEGTVAAAGGSNITIGIGNTDTSFVNLDSNLGMTGSTTSYAYNGLALKQNNNSQPSYGATFTTNDVIGVAFDADAGTLTFYKNNTSQGTAYTGITGTYYPACGGRLSNDSWYMNFGQRPFAYTPPTGFKALNTFNLPTPTITQSNKNFDVTTFTGNASTNVIVNSGLMQPDMVWLKSRTNANNHTLFDSVRGVNNLLYPNLTNQAATGTAQLTSFNSNGFTLGASENSNDSFGELSVGWQWKESVSAGFDILTYTGNGGIGASSQYVNHNLGVTPNLIITKVRSSGATYPSWYVYLSAVQSGNFAYYGILNSSNPWSTGSSPYQLWTANTTQIAFGETANESGKDYVAYVFAEVAGYSKFGSYTGTGAGDSNGPFIYCGFRPALIIIKVNTAGYNWAMMDTDRPGYNSISYRIMADAPNEETTVGDPQLDFLSNGFKLRAGNANYAGTVYYIAFAENPFKYANAR